MLLLFSLFAVLTSWRDALAAQLHLTWVDTSNDEDGFRIERRTGTDETFVFIANQSANLTSYTDYTDTDLALGTRYCYRVQAFNASGESPYSNEACSTTSTLLAALESPEDGQPVSGIGVIRGWAFDTKSERQVRSIELSVDGVASGKIPCCSPRGDVQAVFPQFPPQNAGNSGWGVAVNWGALSAGTHMVQVKIENTAGETLPTQTCILTVVRPGGFPFIDRFSLSGAAAKIEGEELVLQGVVVRDQTTQQQNEIDARFRWFTSAQSVGLVQATTMTQRVSLQALLFARALSLAQWLRIKPVLVNAEAASGVVGLIESPESGQTTSGIGVFRGWAFAMDPAATIREIRLLVDGQPLFPILCCTDREDVAVAFSGNTNARNSGWGMPVNYGNLSTGSHSLGVRIEDSLGGTRIFEQGIAVIQVGGFPFLDQVSLSGATAQIEGEDVVLSGVQVRDKASQQIRVITIRLRWFQGSQSLVIVSSI